MENHKKEDREQKVETHKVQFNFTPEALAELEALQERVEAPSRAETIRYALRILQWVADEVTRGNKICVATNEGTREVIIPFISNKRKAESVK